MALLLELVVVPVHAGLDADADADAQDHSEDAQEGNVGACVNFNGTEAVQQYMFEAGGTTILITVVRPI